MREDAGLSRSEKNTSKDRNVRGVGIVIREFFGRVYGYVV